MIAVLQRVIESSVKANGESAGKIGKGLMILLGVAEGDTENDADILIKKIPYLRIFEDENGKMNLSCLDTGGEILVVSSDVQTGKFGADMKVSLINDGPVTIILNSKEL